MGEQRDGQRRGHIWASEDGSGWFLVPDDAALQEGDHPIRDLLGRVRRVQRQALAPFEVESQAARELARREIVGWLGKLQANVGSVARHLEEKSKGSGQSLQTLQQIVGGIVNRLAKPGEIPPKTASEPVDLVGRLEALAQTIASDPERIEGLRKAAADLEAAAERLKALTPPRR